MDKPSSTKIIYDCTKLTDDEIRAPVQAVFGKRACRFQITAARQLLAGNDVILAAATGLGKTLSFWIGLVVLQEMTKLQSDAAQGRVVLVVTPLVVLGEQNERILKEANLTGIAVDKRNLADKGLFKVCFLYEQAMYLDNLLPRTLRMASITL
jgi:ATP-dependent helicase YprA (DUF1998 family)